MVSGPSGAGKSSVVAGLAERLPFHFSVSMTTRPPRPGEVDGADYFFVDRDRFLAARAAGELLEWAEYSGHLYGTPRAQVEGPLAAGEDVLLDIELLGAEQVKAAFPEARAGVHRPAQPARCWRPGCGGGATPGTSRWPAAWRWPGSRSTQARAWFDHIVVNDDLERAIDEVAGILTAPAPPGSPS